MIKLTAREISLIVNGSLHGDENILVTEAPVFDSRRAKSGSLFLALIGENTDGHNFISDACGDRECAKHGDCFAKVVGADARDFMGCANGGE